MSELPIVSHKDEIQAAVGRSRVVIIDGEAGCGKTKKAPGFVYEALLSKDPNAVEAVAIPKRAAVFNAFLNNRCQPYNVTYQHGGARDRNSINEQILFVTPGILLNEAYPQLALGEAYPSRRQLRRDGIYHPRQTGGGGSGSTPTPVRTYRDSLRGRWHFPPEPEASVTEGHLPSPPSGRNSGSG